jgi:AhpC/TSA family protein
LGKEIKVGCGNRPSTTTDSIEENKKSVQENYLKEEKNNMIMVGKHAPTFTAPAFHEGKFTEVNLEDYKGKWVLLCFYPGDFTFV